MTAIKLGIIGNGFVGKATQQLEGSDISILCYDINPNLCKPIGLTLKQIAHETDLIFISVPTPMSKDGSCHLNILESVVQELSEHCDLNQKHVVIRCTVPPGTSTRLNCYYMPEFLTEKNYLHDFKHNPEWIFGIKNNKQDVIFKTKIQQVFDISFKQGTLKSNQITFLPQKEAEMVKLFRNIFLATKVALCNEIYDFCQLNDIQYDTMIKHACNDSRIGHSHTAVPGHDGHRGFGGTCFPKDINNLNHLMKLSEQVSYIIPNVIKRNEEKDRCNKDWLLDKGRASV